MAQAHSTEEESQMLSCLTKMLEVLDGSDPKPTETPISTTSEPTSPPPDIPSSFHQLHKSHLHREFKISGQINVNCGISFTSLIRQIEYGIKKGYPEIEVIDGVIKAIPTSSKLRDYLEGREDLGLSTLRGILRSHYREKSATERYNELGAATQGTAEEPSEFLMRTLDIRNKILFSSQETASELKYDPVLVNGLFRRTIYTGLRDLAIRQEFRSHLEKDTIADEDLIHELNRIVSKETERKSKFSKTARTSEVKVVEDSTPVPTKVGKSSPKEGILITEVKALRAELADLKGLIGKVASDPQTSADVHPTYPRRATFKPGCQKCAESDRANLCDHCWRCGSAEHFKKGCRVGVRSNTNSGNDPRSHRGDRR